MNRLFEYAVSHPYLLAATVLVALIAIVLEIRHRSHGSAAVGPAEAVQLANQGALVLDVRSAEQFAEGHIIDARHIVGPELENSVEALKKYREKPVVVYCESGVASAAAARMLKSKGFTKAVNLKGGVQAWKQENLPLVKDPAKGNSSRNSAAKAKRA